LVASGDIKVSWCKVQPQKGTYKLWNALIWNLAATNAPITEKTLWNSMPSPNGDGDICGGAK